MTAGRKNKKNPIQDWCTPPKYVNAIKRVLGEIYLDPCSNFFSIIGARREIMLPEDGLLVEWNYKTIYVNPPYGRGITNWLGKCREAYQKYQAEVLALIPVATNTRHWKENIFKTATGICFLEDTRLKFFIGGKESQKGAPMACAMIYWGMHYDQFALVFSKYGMVFRIERNRDGEKENQKRLP